VPLLATTGVLDLEPLLQQHHGVLHGLLTALEHLFAYH